MTTSSCPSSTALGRRRRSWSTPTASPWRRLRGKLWLGHRGDLTSDDPAAVAAAVKKADPEGKALIVVTAAPPCQDFSRISQSPGHAGQGGALFLATALGVPLRERRHGTGALRRGVQGARRRPHHGVRLGLRGWISRPRLWWLYPSILQATVDPASGKPLHWAKHGSYRRLRLEEPRQPESELVVDDLRFHPAVAAGRLKLPWMLQPLAAPRRPTFFSFPTLTSLVGGGGFNIRDLMGRRSLAGGGPGSRMRPRRRPALYWRFCDGPRRDAPFIHPKRRARR